MADKNIQNQIEITPTFHTFGPWKQIRRKNKHDSEFFPAAS